MLIFKLEMFRHNRIDFFSFLREEGQAEKQRSRGQLGHSPQADFAASWNFTAEKTS